MHKPDAPGHRNQESGEDKTGHTGEREISSETLLGPSGILRIRHGNEHYTLRRTRAGRLILTK